MQNTTCVVMALLLISADCLGQSDSTKNHIRKSALYYGFDAGISVADAWGKLVAGREIVASPGIALGFTLKFEATKAFYLKTGLQISHRDVEARGQFSGAKINADYYMMPFLMGIQLARPYGVPGPKLGIEFGTSFGKVQDDDNLYDGPSSPGSYPGTATERSPWMFTLMSGIALEIPVSRSVNISFTYRYISDLSSYYVNRYYPTYSTYIDSDIRMSSYLCTAGVMILVSSEHK